ncbi:MAG: DUF1553 domain-containing protein [Planctomycetes bacterium]|nr:DUF1553 domain-containing protein [Planctomycetota bacterium]
MAMQVILRSSAAWLLLGGLALCQSPSSESALEILRDRCIQCHGQRIEEGKLRLDHRDGLLHGGESGKAIQLGHSAESLLIARVSATDETRMPPDGQALTQDQIEILRRFIDQGAPWGNQNLQDSRMDHWAWQPLRPTNVPWLDTQSDANPIDRFLAVAMSKRGVEPLPRASRKELIRRLSFDVVGAPPSPEEVQEYETDLSEDAWERLVDRMLASPQYGERWARHWLDIAHYADTHGFERDQRRDHAWPYRDWVIDALNTDLPYDQFILHQIAGDVLPDKDPRSTIASSFLAVGPWDFVGQVETPSPVIKRLARADDLDDIVTQVMTSFCGVTVHCARCHHHKLDPVGQQEYYGLTAIFSGVKRGDRLVWQDEAQAIEATRSQLKGRKLAIDQELLKLSHGLLLADIVGGGNGFGTGLIGVGVDPSTAGLKQPHEKSGFLDGVVANRLNPTENPWIDSVFVPDGGAGKELAISQSGKIARGIPATGAKVWDAIRNGPVNSQFSTSLDGVDCAPPGHSMLSLHANAGITFRLKADLLDQSFSPQENPSGRFVFSGMVGYFGQTPTQGADAYILVDGQVVNKFPGLGRDDGLKSFRIELPKGDSLLTLIATDHGNGIGHDQICFIDASIAPLDPNTSAQQKDRIESLAKESGLLQGELDRLPEPRKVYGVLSETPASIRLLHRGNTEEPGQEVLPSALACVGPNLASIARLDAQSTDAQRRLGLAQWICSEENPLPARVIVNRLWHHHFGKGIVATPSDFGLGGALPSHPELLDWLALQLQQGGWSLKRLHRLILLSEAYRRSSIDAHSGTQENSARVIDAGNELLWRQNPRRLDAESLRDAMLSVAGSSNGTMHGPGYRDFEYQEEYAPVYRHQVLDSPEVFRRSIYRFVVRTTPHPFLTSLDCPNPATMTPVRNTTTTAIQSLATLNNAFVLQQSERFANRLQSDVGQDARQQAIRAIQLAFSRSPTPEEIDSATDLIQNAGLFHLCRTLLNTNEFIYVD